MRNNIQNRDGLPAALAEEKRFFELYGSGKTDTPKGWNDPENWKYLEEIPEGKNFGFAIGNGSNYLFIDFDHIKDPETGEVVLWANDVYKRLTKGAQTYYETSMSGTGLHMIADLGEYADNFSQESNGYESIIIQMDPAEYSTLPKEERDKVPKVEFFYHTDGRYCYLTGKNKKVIPVARDEDAAFIFHELLKIREEFHAKFSKHSGTRTTSSSGMNETSGARFALSAAEKEAVLEALPYISASARDTWVKVGIALCNCGFDFEIWDTWSRFADQRTGEICDKYDPEETPKIWKSFLNTKSKWNAGTIIRLAKANGYRQQNEDSEAEYLPEQRETLLLEQFTDVDQARLYADEYGEKVRYSKATGFLVYNGQKWEESDLKAQRLSQHLTDRQLKEAKEMLQNARRIADNEAEENGGKIEPETRAAIKRAERYRADVIKRRAASKISATLTEAAPLLEVDVKQLDRDGFLLNTPGGTVNLRTGELRSHDPADYCTKITGVAPGTDGAGKFEEFLDQITCNDADLKRYLQEVAGEIAIGEVKQEELFISNGEGGNGKSTYFNLLFRVLGDYAGLLSSDVLITNSRKNKSPELAELRGKRMILAAELEEGQRLDTGMIKKIASTDPIRAERKYRDPFDFIPSHSVILYTNHLPKVGARDAGTWDRLRVIPFNARFRNTSGEVKDYASILFDQCGGAVLSWIIEGARRYVENSYKIRLPECVTRALDEYRTANDWLTAFLEEQCFVGPNHAAASGEVYSRYRAYCESMGEFPRSQAEFKKALESVGIKHKRSKTGGAYRGLSLKSWTAIESDKIQAAREAREGA